MTDWPIPNALLQLTERATPMLLDASIKGLVVLTLTGLAALAMRRAAAAARHLIWQLGIAGLLVLPLASIVLPGWHVLPAWASTVPLAPGIDVSYSETEPLMPPSDSSRSAPQAHSLPTASVSTAASASPTFPSVTGLPPTSPEPVHRPFAAAPISRPRAWWLWLTPVWAAGAVLSLLPTVIGLLSLWRLGRSSEELNGKPWHMALECASTSLTLARPVTLLLSECRSMPMAWGTLRPKVLLPQDALTWSDDRRQAVLLHELAHVRRGDCATHIVARLASALHWFNPLAWLAARRLLAESEAACDDLVLGVGLNGPDYAQHLVAVASGAQGRALATSVGIAMARPSRLEGRLLALLDATRSRQSLTRAAVALALAVALLVILPVGSLRPTARAQESARKQPKSTAWHRTLASGGTVELIGVCHSPSKGKQWWRPDGSSLPEAPYDSLDVGLESSDETHQAYEFAMRVSGRLANSECAHFDVVGPGASGGGTGRALKDGLALPDILGAGVAIQRLDRQCAVRFGTPAGPWRTVARSKDRSTVQVNGSTFTFSEIAQANGRVSVTVGDDYRPRDTQCRVVALDRAGTYHDYCASSSLAGRRRYEFRIPDLAAVSAFCVQERPIEFVEFAGVVLPLAPRAQPIHAQTQGDPAPQLQATDAHKAPVLRYLKWEYDEDGNFPAAMRGYWAPTGLRFNENDVDPFAKALQPQGSIRDDDGRTLRLWFQYDGPVTDLCLWPQLAALDGKAIGTCRSAKRSKRDPSTGKAWLYCTAQAINGWIERVHIRTAYPTENWRILKAISSPLPQEPVEIDKDIVWSYGLDPAGRRGPTTLLRLLFKGTQPRRTPYDNIRLGYRHVPVTEDGRALRHKALQWVSTPEGEVMTHTFRVSPERLGEVHVETRSVAMTTIRNVPLRPLRDAAQQEPTRGPKPSSSQEEAEAQAGGTSDRASKIELALDRPLSLHFTDTPLPDVIDFLQKQTGIRMLLDPRIAKAPPAISVRLENVHLREALDAIVKQAAKLTYRVANDGVAISDAKGFAYYFMRAYDVQGLFPAAKLRQEPRDERVPTDLDELVEQIVREIEPRSWRLALGATRGITIAKDDMEDAAKGQIMCQGNSLLVWHTRAAQHKIAKLLESLRQGSQPPPSASPKKEDAELARPPHHTSVNNTDPETRRRQSELFASGWRALREERFDEAYETANQILEIDPGHEPAKILRVRASKGKHAQRLVKIRSRFEAELKKRDGTAPEKTIELTDAVTHPDKEVWEDVVARRRRIAASPGADQTPPQVRRIHEKLGKRVSLDLTQTPFLDAISLLQDLSGINMMLDPDAIDGRGPFITLKLKGAAAQSALNLIVRRFGKLDYVIRHDGIFISGKSDLAKYELRKYDVRDIVRANDASSSNRAKSEEAIHKRALDLLRLISTVVAPQSWQHAFLKAGDTQDKVDIRLGARNEDAQGGLVFEAGELSVWQTPKAHKDVGNVLTTLRQQKVRTAARAHAYSDQSAKDRQARLRRPVTVAFKDTPFPDAIRSLLRGSRLTVELDQRALAECELTITLKADKMPLDRALDVIVKDLAGLDYEIRRDAIHISTRERLAPALRCYDVRDLLAKAADGQPTNATTDDAKNLLRAIVVQVQPDTWKRAAVLNAEKDSRELQVSPAGGRAKGSIVYREGDLYVRQTAGAHGEIADLLHGLRQASQTDRIIREGKQGEGRADRPKPTGHGATEARTPSARKALAGMHAKRPRDVKVHPSLEGRSYKSASAKHGKPTPRADSAASSDQATAPYESRKYDVNDILAKFGRPSNGHQPGVTAAMAKIQRSTDLLVLISAVIDRDSWRSAVVKTGGPQGDLDVEVSGSRKGGDGSLLVENGQLIVHQTPAGHAGVAGLLSQLRKRVLTVVRRMENLRVIATNAPLFDPVVEFTVYQNEPFPAAMDLDRARFLHPPRRLKGSRASLDWGSENGLDLSTPMGIKGVWFQDTVVVPVPDSEWDNISPSALRAKTEQYLERTKAQRQTTSLNCFSPGRWPLLGTCLFVTLEGGCGILQATQIGERNTAYLRVRYKMLRRPNDSPAR